MKISEEEFQSIMEKAIDKIPDYFQKKLENIVFLVEQYPSDTDLSRVGLRDRSSLLGLYSGVPYTYRNTGYTGSIPDRIILFQKNIERLCNTSEQLEHKIIEVVIHEVAHYFGMDDDEIRDAGF